MKNLKLKQDKAILSVNPSLYSLEVIYSAAYVLMDEAYFMLSGDPSENIKVHITPKEDIEAKELKEIALKFNNEMINYSLYAVQASRNKELRSAIIKRALATNRVLQEKESSSKEFEEEKEVESEDEFEDIEVKDPEGIAEPWTPDKAPGESYYDEEKEYEE